MKVLLICVLIMLSGLWLLNLLIYSKAPSPNGCKSGWLKKHYWDIVNEDRTYSGWVSWTNHIDWKCKKCGKEERVDCQEHIKS